jgi:hypothetical protein
LPIGVAPAFLVDHKDRFRREELPQRSDQLAELRPGLDVAAEQDDPGRRVRR